MRISRLLPVCLLAVLPAWGQGGTTLDRFFHGEVVALKGNRVTLHYDFETLDQLDDFEEVRPPGLLGALTSRARIEGGRLILEGSAAVRHRAAGGTRMNAVFLASLSQKGNFGIHLTEPEPGPAWRLLNLFDYRILRDGKLRWSAMGAPAPEEEKSLSRRHAEEAKLPSRPVFVADPEEVARRVVPGQPVEIEVYKEGSLEGCRIGTMHRWGSCAGLGGAMDSVQFGFWVQGANAAIDELTLTLEITDRYARTQGLVLGFADDPRLRAESTAALAKVIREAPLSKDAAAARRELSRRGEEGWKKLVSLISKFERRKAYAAVALVASLADGDEEGRRELLLDLHGRIRKPELRTPILNGLANWYPKDKELVHTGLFPPYGARAVLLRKLLHRGLPDEVIKALTGDGQMAEEAFEVLRARKGTLAGVSLAQLARIRAREAYNPPAALDFRKGFAAEPNWKLVDELTRLLEDEDEHLAQGAHLLLMTISGKEIAADPDLWRSWMAAQADVYEPPDLASPGIIAAAVIRGRTFLIEDLREDGACVWPTNVDWPGCRIGATALAVNALRVSGVPGSDPVIRKAIRTTLLRDGIALRGDMERYTYALALLSLALTKVDRVQFKPLIDVLSRRIIGGQLDNGQWTYRCYEPGYQDEPRPAVGDNSNTQYAILALREARRAGVEIPDEVWARCAKFLRESPNRNGGWGYGFGSSLHELSMTAAGIATLSICVEALLGEKAGAHLRLSPQVARGHQRLGELLLTAGFRGEEIYAMYGVERACVLTGVRAHDQFDWYREGARVLVAEQKDSGAWGDPNVRGVTTGMGYGEAVDTSYAILFLKLSTTAVPGAGEGNVIDVKRVKK